MQHLTRSLLEGRISRRAFVSQLAAAGFAAPVAASLSLQSPQSGRSLQGLTGGELMAEFLLDWNVPYVFGLGGSEEVGFLDALADRLKLNYVLALHEGSALSMADGYARASSRTGFVNLHSVAGSAYALGPMVNAFKDRTPLVVTAGRQSTDMRGSEAFLEAVNLHTLPRDYSRWCWDVLSAASIPETLRRAFLIARVPPGGPTFVTFSKDLWETRVERANILPPSRTPVEDGFLPAAEAISRAADLLLKADFPLLIAGREISLYGGAQHLAEIAELLGAPVMLDVPASHSPAVFPTTHPLFAGYFTLEEGFPPQFDLFASWGGTMFTLFSRPRQPLVDPKTTVIHASIDGTQIGRNYPVDLALAGHVGKTLEALAAELGRRGPSGAAIEQRRRTVEQFHRQRRQILQQQARRVWNQFPIAPERLAVELNRLLPSDAIVVSETATSDLYLWRHLDFEQSDAGRKHITSAGGCLGWGLGAAIGAKIGSPERPVALMVGDGSFTFGVQALWSAARYEVPVAVIIWNNNAYQANRRALHGYQGRAAATGKYIGCSLGHPRIQHVEIAKGYGVEAELVDKPSGLEAALKRCFAALESGRPYVLDVHIAPRFPGSDSQWYDSFSVARGQGRQS